MTCTRVSFLLFITAIFFASNHVADAAALTRDLSVGSTGPDVYDLQVFLNSNASTAISGTGDGSKGKETQYFGALTAAAVSRFQAAHPDETYRKAGLSAPNGYAGSLTRALINSMMGYSTVPVPTTVSTSGGTGGYIFDPLSSVPTIKPAPSVTAPIYGASSAYSDAFIADLNAFMTNNPSLFAPTLNTVSTSTTASASATTSDPMITFLSVNVAKVGDVVTIFGVALPDDLIIELDGYNIKTNVSDDARKATFTVPRRDEKEYEVTFTSESEKITYPKRMKFRVTSANTQAPTLSDYPKTMESGQSVTISGANFDTSAANTVVTAAGAVSVTTKSSTSLTFTVPYLSKNAGARGPVQFPNGPLYVENNFGRSMTVMDITYTLR